MVPRAQRIAFMLLPGLDHFTHDLIASLPVPGALEVRAFHVRALADLDAACAWADDPARDAIWFEFCWPPFPAMIAQYDFGGRRVVMRIHRIEAYETRHAAGAPWHKIDDAIVVSEDMAARLRAQAPRLERSTALHVVHNGVDVERFVPRVAEAFSIGWCGLLNLRKNPLMALEILHFLRQDDYRWHMHICSKGGDPVALDNFSYLRRRLGLVSAVTMDGDVSAASMPAWHARNFVLLSTSLHESFGYAVLKLLLIARAPMELDVRVVVNMAGSVAAGLRAYETLAAAASGFLHFRPALGGVVRRDERVKDAIRRQSLLLSRTPQSIAGQDVEQIAAKLLKIHSAEVAF
jgi:glycosyltransferase involved in cell wall biosynthesis